MMFSFHFPARGQIHGAYPPPGYAWVKFQSRFGKSFAGGGVYVAWLTHQGPRQSRLAGR